MKKTNLPGGATVLKRLTALPETAPSQGAGPNDPTPDLVLEMLGSSLPGNMSADMADAYGGACLAACDDRPGVWGTK
jgi:hypothetical protein